MSITIKSGAKVLYQWERGVALTASTPCDILRISREDDRVTDDLYPVISGSTGTALIPDRMLTESGYLHVSRIDISDGSERVLETVRILVRHAAKPQSTSSSTKEIADMQVLRMQMAALERAAREGKFDGKDGITPHVGENGNWFAGDVDLGVHAQGNKGDKGDPGDTPYVGANGNWFVGDFDTGVKAKSEDVSLYAEDLYTSGVLVTDDLESFVMTGGVREDGKPQIVTSPGVAYIKGVRRWLNTSRRTYDVRDTDRVQAQYLRLNETTGEIGLAIWHDVTINGDLDNGCEIVDEFTGEVIPKRSGGFYDVILCIATIPAGATEVTPDMIRDLRGDERYCGFVRSKVDGGANALNEHNVSGTAHSDIRLLISGLSERLNAIADSDDTTLDQLSEIVAYIKSNKTLIESVTTSKVNVADIIDNLTTSVSDQPLSAKMGVELRRLISVVENSAYNAMSKASEALDQASSAESVASSAMNHASSAEEIASSAMQRASSAESVASSAMNHASSAEEIASSAMQRASSAEQMASAAQTEIEKLKENGVPGGGALTAENIETALGYTPANAETVEELSEAIDELKENGIGGGITEETDPTVPAWAKEPEKPKYTAQEVGAATKEQFEQVSEAIENQQTALDGKQPKGDYALKSEIPSMPDVPVKSVNGKTGAVLLSASDVGARPSTWTPSAEDVGADESGTADSKVTAHNTSDESHNDIRLLITGLTTRLNALANSTDEELDQLAEIVAYTKANKSLIDSITTSKVSVVDIIDNLTTSVSNKPLSAKMGVELKKLIDAIEIPTSLPASDVQNWAKQPTKPTYTKSEVGLGNVDNVRQYSASNPPPYPVTSVNGQTGAVSVTADDIGAARKETVNRLSETIADLESDVERSVKTVNGTAPDDNGNVDVIANIEPPKIVSSVSEMTDTDKQYVLQSTGTIWANKTGTTTETVENNEYNPSYTTGLNLRLSINDGTHRPGATGRYTTDYIEITPTAPYTVTLKGLSSALVIVDDTYYVVHYFGADKAYLGYAAMSTLGNSSSSGALPMSFDMSKYAKFSSAKYVRITLHISTASITSANLNGLIINFAPKNTVTTTAGRSWTDTGIPYAPTFKTDLIGVMGEGNVIYLSDNLPSGTYTLKYPDDDYAVIGTITK